MYAYCVNNPVIYYDANGQKVVGIGIQLEIQLGDVSLGLELILYFDPTVCGGSDYVFVMYDYSGYEVSVEDVASLAGKVEAILMTVLTEGDNFSFDTFLGSIQSLFHGVGASGAFFWIDTVDGLDPETSFNSPYDYSKGFETLSFSGSFNGTTVSGFHSYTDICDVYGVKIGAKVGIIKPLRELPFGGSYSRTYYSEPVELWRKD